MEEEEEGRSGKEEAGKREGRDVREEGEEEEEEGGGRRGIGSERVGGAEEERAAKRKRKQESKRSKARLALQHFSAADLRAGPKPETQHPLYPTPNILHPTPYTLHPTSYTLHPTPYTLHPTTYDRHPAICTFRVRGDATSVHLHAIFLESSLERNGLRVRPNPWRAQVNLKP
jgi:hypothetical protein